MSSMMTLSCNWRKGGGGGSKEDIEEDDKDQWEDDSDDCAGGRCEDEEETGTKFTNYSMSSSVIWRNQQLWPDQ